MRELGDTAGDVVTQVLGYNASGFTCFQLGEFNAGRAYLEKAFALYDPAHRPSYAELLPNDERVQLRSQLSWLLACLGYIDQAFLHRAAALDEAGQLSHPLTSAFARSSAWWTGSFVRLRPGSLLKRADETLALAIEHGLGMVRAMALIWRGWCLAALGRADEGIPLLAAGIVGWDELGFRIWRPWVVTLLGDARRMAGQWQAALDHFTEARRLAEETGDRWAQAETVRLTGNVLLAIGDRAGAEASYREAIAIALQQSAKLWELRAAMSLARLWRDQGKRTAARDLLVPVYNWFTEGFGTPVLQEARALLDELADAPALPVSGSSATVEPLAPGE
jgi:predicted ATPase